MVLRILLGLVSSLVGATVFAAPGDLVSVDHVYDQNPGFARMARSRYCPAATTVTKDFGYSAYRVTFKTLDLKGVEVSSKGLLMVPGAGAGKSPLFVYQHGTLIGRSELPSEHDHGKISESAQVGQCFASAGYVSILADYLGFNDGTGVHPYLHADSEASVARDLMRAARAALVQIKTEMNGKIFVAGYSQGGHAAMALLRLLAQDPAQEFKVTAGAPMAGPYDMAATMPIVFNNPTEHSATELAYILVGLNPLYGFYHAPQEIFQNKYAKIVEGLFDGTNTWIDVLPRLMITPAELVKPDYVSRELKPGSHFMNSMAANSVYQFVPKFPMRLYHGGDDHEVPYANSEVAEKAFKALGADVEVVNLGASVDHGQGGPLAMGQALLWFETL